MRIQYQVQNETQVRKNQKIFNNVNDELVVRNYPENKQSIIKQPKFELPNCPSCKRTIWLDFDKGYYCKNCEYNIDKQKNQID